MKPRRPTVIAWRAVGAAVLFFGGLSQSHEIGWLLAGRNGVTTSGVVVDKLESDRYVVFQTSSGEVETTLDGFDTPSVGSTMKVIHAKNEPDSFVMTRHEYDRLLPVSLPLSTGYLVAGMVILCARLPAPLARTMDDLRYRSPVIRRRSGGESG